MSLINDISLPSNITSIDKLDDFKLELLKHFNIDTTQHPRIHTGIRKEQILHNRLILGNHDLNSNLHKRNLHDTDNCQQCNTNVEENVLQLQDLVANLTDDATLVRTEQVKKARNALKAGEKEKAKLQMTLKQALLDIRSGKEDTQGLDQWKIDFEDGVLSDSKIQETEN